MTARKDVQTHNMKVLRSLVEGDLVQFERIGYSHWGVYVGNMKVIHRTVDDDACANMEAPSTVCCSKNSIAIVKKDDFWKVTCGFKAHKKNVRDRNTSPFSPEEIVRRAESKIGEKGYNVVLSSCEHFANFCRYGESQSGQAIFVKSLLVVLYLLIKSPDLLTLGVLLAVVIAVGNAAGISDLGGWIVNGCWEFISAVMDFADAVFQGFRHRPLAVHGFFLILVGQLISFIPYIQNQLK